MQKAESGAGAGDEAVVAEQPVAEQAIDERCNAKEHLDFDGPAVSWGMSFKMDSAAECCKACMEHTRKPGQPADCNSWVWCPEAVCWSPDIWYVAAARECRVRRTRTTRWLAETRELGDGRRNHTFGECWLKIQDDIRSPQVKERFHGLQELGGSTAAPLLRATASSSHMPLRARLLSEARGGIRGRRQKNAEGAYSAQFRGEHKTAPEWVPWMAGVIDRSQL